MLMAFMAIGLAFLKMIPGVGALVTMAGGGIVGVLLAAREDKTGGIVLVYAAVGGAAAGLVAASVTWVDELLTQKESYVAAFGTARFAVHMKKEMFDLAFLGVLGGAAIGVWTVSLFALAAKSVAAVIRLAAKILPAKSRNESLQEDTRHDS